MTDIIMNAEFGKICEVCFKSVLREHSELGFKSVLPEHSELGHPSFINHIRTGCLKYETELLTIMPI
jgi:hypothetical protein